MYKQVDNYYAMMQAVAGQPSYALDFGKMTIKSVGGMTVSEINDNFVYITEEPQSEENSGKTAPEEEKIDTEKCQKTRENTEAQPTQQILEEKAEVEEAKMPKSSSLNTDSEEVESTTRKKIEAEEKKQKQKKAVANAKFREQTEQQRITEQWVDLHAQGKSKTQIGQEYGKATSTVSKYIEQYLQQVRDKIDYGKFMALRNANWSNKKIASEFHVAEGAIRLLIERGM